MKLVVNRGFTLIELLVVVLIIGILAAVAVPQYQKAVEKSRLTEALINIKTIQNCLDVYQLEHGLPSTRLNLPDMNCPIDAALGEWDEDRARYVSEYFTYQGYCTSFGCSIEIHRFPNDDYAFEIVHPNSKACYTSNTDMGSYICNSLIHDGWEYLDMEL